MFVDDDEAFYYCGCWIPIWAYGILRFVGVMAGPLAWLRLFHVDSSIATPAASIRGRLDLCVRDGVANEVACSEAIRLMPDSPSPAVSNASASNASASAPPTHTLIEDEAADVAFSEGDANSEDLRVVYLR